MPKIKIDLMYIVIATSILFFIMQNFINNSQLIFGINALFLQHSFYFQPLTSIFIHGGILHLAMNMVVLFQFWTILKNYIPSTTLFLIFIIGGMIVSLLSFAYIYMFDTRGTVVGASGAISIFIGIMAYIDEDRRKGFLLFILIISFAPMLFGVNIAWYAHLFGFGIGFLWAYIKQRSNYK
jgi:membrane associated rhomboid family serine protease